jgi:hypothetical protein
MGTNCAPLLVDVCLYSHEAEFVQKLLNDKNKNQFQSRIVERHFQQFIQIYR